MFWALLVIFKVQPVIALKKLSLQRHLFFMILLGSKILD